jgi:tetratricopeptide (TPR) repeat protein
MSVSDVTERTHVPLPARLLDNIADGKCVLFLGAGISIDSGGPRGQELSDEIAEHFLHIAEAGYPLSEVAALVDAEDGRRQLNDWLVSRLGGLQPSSTLFDLPRFRWRAIYTVNFDTLVEQAYSQSEHALQRLHPVYSDRDPISNLDQDEVPLHKLHGCVSRPNSEEGHLVLTQDDFARVEGSRQRLFNRLIDHVADLPVLYVGFARVDSDFARVLAQVDRAIVDLSGLTRSYAAQPAFLEAEAKRAELKKVTLLDLSANDLLSALHSSLDEARRTGAAKAEETTSRLVLRRAALKSDAISGVVIDFEIPDDVLVDAETDSEAFFKGGFPSWGDISANLDAERDLQDPLLEAILVDTGVDSGTTNLVLLHAEAGSGKSTLLRRVAYELVTTWDRVVLSLKPFGGLNFLAVEPLTMLLQERVFVFVDDALRLPVELRAFLDAARRARAKVTVVTAARTNEWRESQETSLLNAKSEFELDPLSAPEIERVLDTLGAHGQLGYLDDADRETQRRAFVSRAQKQLLVALREATEGKDFDEILADEFERIPSNDGKRAYLYVAALHPFGLMTRAAVLHRALRIPLAELSERVFRPTAKILVEHEIDPDPEPYYGTRHPLIAELVFDRRVATEAERLGFYITLIRELDLGYASDSDTYRRLSRSLNRHLLRDFQSHGHQRQLMREIQELDPTDAFVYQHAAMMELSFGDFRVASAHIARAIEARPNDVTIRDTEGRIVLAGVDRESSKPRKLAELAEAEAIFSRNISRRPNEPYGYRHLAETYWKRTTVETDPSRQAHYFGATYEVLSDGLNNATNTSMLLQYQAEIEEEAGNRNVARGVLDGALKERPDDVPMRVMAARLARAAGDRAHAIDLLRDGVAVVPDAWEFHYRLALALADSGSGDPGEIGRHFAAALLAPLRRYRPRLAYAVWLFSQRDYDKADEQFARLEQIELPNRDRFDVRTFRFGTLGGRQEGRISRLSYANGHVEYDGGATRVFFRTSALRERGSAIRVGAAVSYRLCFSLLGPLAHDVAPG